MLRYVCLLIVRPFGEVAHPLLGSNKDEVADAIAWAHQYKKSKVVYLMPGFSKKAYQNESYRKFLSNSLNYVASPAE